MICSGCGSVAGEVVKRTIDLCPGCNQRIEDAVKACAEQPDTGHYPIYVVGSEPRVRRRMWPPEKRARTAAREAISGEGLRPERFVLVLRSGETYLVGHHDGVITHLVSHSR